MYDKTKYKSSPCREKQIILNIVTADLNECPGQEIGCGHDLGISSPKVYLYRDMTRSMNYALQ